MKCVMFVICKVLLGDGAMYGVFAVCELHVNMAGMLIVRF